MKTLTQSRYYRYNFNLPARSCSTGNIYLARHVKVKWDALDMLITFEFAWEWIGEKLSSTVMAISLSHGFCHLSMLARVKPNLVERKKNMRVERQTDFSLKSFVSCVWASGKAPAPLQRDASRAWLGRRISMQQRPPPPKVIKQINRRAEKCRPVWGMLSLLHRCVLLKVRV